MMLQKLPGVDGLLARKEKLLCSKMYKYNFSYTLFLFLLVSLEFIYFPLFVTTQFGTLTFRLISLRRSLGTKRMFTELWRGLWIDLWELYLVFPLIFLLMLVIHNLLGLIISFLFYVLTNFLYLCFLTKSSIQVNEFINVSNSQSAWTHNSISVYVLTDFPYLCLLTKSSIQVN